MSYAPILKPIVRSPHFPAYLEKLQQIWEEERKNRATFYDWVTPDIKAEFIDGEVVIHSPVRSRHNVVLNLIQRLVTVYVDIHDLGYVGVEKVMTRFPRNDYEPDLCFFGTEKSKDFHPELTLFPVPDFIIEVTSPSTEARDRGVKYQDYQKNGVQEYWIVDPATEEVEQYLLREEEYVLANENSKTITSQVLAGFEISIKSLFDKTKNLEALSLLSSKE